MRNPGYYSVKGPGQANKTVEEEFGSWIVVFYWMGKLCICPLIPMGSQNSDNTDYF